MRLHVLWEGEKLWLQKLQETGGLWVENAVLLTNPQFRLIKRIDGLIVLAFHSPMTRPCTGCSDVNLITSFFFLTYLNQICIAKTSFSRWVGAYCWHLSGEPMLFVLRCFLLYQFITKNKSNVRLKADPGIPSSNALGFMSCHIWNFHACFFVITNKFTARYHLISWKFVIMWYCFPSVSIILTNGL